MPIAEIMTKKMRPIRVLKRAWTGARRGSRR